MAKTGLLTDLAVKRAQPGDGHARRYGDGGGLYLQVKHGGARSWVFRWKRDGKAQMMGLGAYPAVSLADAREKARTLREQLGSGRNPLAEREAEAQRREVEQARAMTFRQCADAYIAAHAPAWTPKHTAQWKQSLTAHAYPVIGDLPVSAIDEPLVLKVLEQQVEANGKLAAGTLWTARAETANRVRNRIEAILDWARVKKHRAGDNPARWAGNLEYSLPSLTAVRTTQHYAALPFAQVAGFMAALREQDTTASLALQFVLLTVGRANEVTGARWSEIDEEKEVWTIPAARMKARREHRVPLSKAALVVLAEAKKRRKKNDLVFPSPWGNKAGLSTKALALTSERLGYDAATTHGFRSSFRDWVAEETDFAGEVAEMALAHAIGNQTEAAYRRGDLFEKRRTLMAAWANYCEGKSNVVPITTAVAA